MQNEITNEAYINVEEALVAQGVDKTESIHGLTICLLTTQAGIIFLGKSTHSRSDAYADAVSQINHHYAYGPN